MGDTLATMATSAARYGYGGADDTARLKAFINETYRDVFYRQKWTWAENLTTVTLNAGSSSVAVPAGSYQYGEIRKITTPDQGADPPVFVPFSADGTLEFMNRNVTATGRPERYTIFAGSFYFDRIADVQYVFQFFRWNEPATLADADEPVIPQYGREVLQWGALMRQALRDKDADAYGRFAALFEDRLLQLKEADIQGRPAARARMADEYGRAYD